MQFKMEMLNLVAKYRGSVTGKSGFILLSSCFPISVLNPVCVFLMAFTSSAYAVTFVSTSVENVTFLSSFFTFTPLLSLFEFLSLFPLLCLSFMLLYLP
jgi:hypothetical protein